ncbi:hypothetical protein ACFWZA_12445 [[Kitasatospora] papulosa]|uniref:hypothetical protein n=1 Tax=[Kitasatospora] papulosa TaxID=1464011 RepID=UPI003682B783
MSHDAFELSLLREDLAYHQARIMLLVTAVTETPGHQGKLDGLTKLAKLDFLVRYPALAPQVLEELTSADPRLHLTPADDANPTDVEAPMIRYKYGPWDDRYYSVIGALVGRGLVAYRRGKQGSVAIAPTPAGKKLVKEMSRSSQWASINDRCRAVAEASIGLTGNALKDRIYNRLAPLMNRPHRQVIR